MNELDRSKPSILIVDDSPTNIKVLADALKDDYYVRVATDGINALEIVKKNKPMLVLLDVMMPNMDGYEVCRRIKEQNETKDTVVIFVTAKSEVSDEEIGLNLGAVDYIVKPFHMPIVRARVRNHILLQQKTDMLESMALIDGLTNIPNRRHFNQNLELEWHRAQRNDRPLSLIMMDVDFFKRYNDNYGHSMGDSCLEKVAAALNSAVTRPSDRVARYGGEEFAALLPDTDARGALLIAERIRGNVEDLHLPHEHSDASNWVTLSLGLACLTPQPEQDSSTLIKQADEMLYRAKKAGRNRCLCAEQPDCTFTLNRPNVK
ncbi:MAG: PleD family two-component system response regulator [Magnetococcales bacterium]|nr:PleD family two-component system response regulator [Magnetococcales bacterium]